MIEENVSYAFMYCLVLCMEQRRETHGDWQKRTARNIKRAHENIACFSQLNGTLLTIEPLQSPLGLLLADTDDAQAILDGAWPPTENIDMCTRRRCLRIKLESLRVADKLLWL